MTRSAATSGGRMDRKINTFITKKVTKLSVLKIL
jgi:hypothetical protein